MTKQWDYFEYRIAEHYLPAMVDCDLSGMDDTECKQYHAFDHQAHETAIAAGFTVGIGRQLVIAVKTGDHVTFPGFLQCVALFGLWFTDKRVRHEKSRLCNTGRYYPRAIERK